MAPPVAPTRTYRLPSGVDAGEIVQQLAAALDVLKRPRLKLAPPRARRSGWTVFDTADRRLRAQGLDLRIENGSGALGLVLAAPGGARPLTVDVRRRRRYRLDDVPEGPLRDQLAPVLEVRALLPVVEVRCRRIAAAIINRDDKTVVRVSACDLWSVPPGDRAPVAVSGRLEVAGVLGYPRPLDQLVTLVEQDLGLTAAEEPLADEAVRAIGKDPAGLSTSVDVELAPDDPAGDAALRILRRLADVAEANLPGTIADLDPEFLHDLRVAVRRSRSVLRELKLVFAREPRRAQAEALRWVQAITGPTRDLDVQLSEWAALIHQVGADRRAALAPVRAALVARRTAAFTTMRRTVRSPEYRARWAEWRRFLAEPNPDDQAGQDDRAGPHALGQPAVDPVDKVAGRRVRSVYRRMVRDGRAIDAQSPAQDLHDLRKRGKELRYLLELFGGLWPAAKVAPVVSSLKKLQDVLGRHQDREVQAAHLRALAPELSGADGGAEALLALGSLVDRLEDEQRQARQQFGERFAAFAALGVPRWAR